MSVTRQLIFSTSLEDNLSVSGFYSFKDLIDGNSSGSYFSCAYIPAQKSGTISMRPNVVFLGTQGSTMMLQSLNESKIKDGDQTITATFISNMIVPNGKGDEPLEMNRFISLEMGNINSLPDGVVIEYLVDEANPHLTGPIWSATHYEAGTNRVFFPRAVGRWIHIRITDSTGITSSDVWSGFTLSYYPLGTRPEDAGS